MLWCFLALCYCVRHHFRAFGDDWVSGSLKGAMRAPLRVLVVLLCSAYRVCSCSMLFKAPLLYFLYSLILYLPTRFSTVLPVQCDRYWGIGWSRVFVEGEARGWVTSRVGSWVFLLFGFGVSNSSPPCCWAPNFQM